MWRVTIIINAGILGIMSLGAAVSQMRLRNNYLQYSDASRSQELLPLISHFAIKAYWLIYTLPLAWLLVSVLLISILNERPEKRGDWILCHTSITLFLGICLLLFFVMAGLLPFTKLYVHLTK